MYSEKENHILEEAEDVICGQIHRMAGQNTAMTLADADTLQILVGTLDRICRMKEQQTRQN